MKLADDDDFTELYHALETRPVEWIHLAPGTTGAWNSSAELITDRCVAIADLQVSGRRYPDLPKVFN